MKQNNGTKGNNPPKAKRSRAKVGVTTAKESSQLKVAVITTEEPSQSGVAGITTEEPSQQDFINSLSTALRSFEKKLVDTDGFKPTLAEYLKLRQFERELQLDAELPREIKITWIEPDWASKET